LRLFSSARSDDWCFFGDLDQWMKKVFVLYCLFLSDVMKTVYYTESTTSTHRRKKAVVVRFLRL